jgi:hypothetical protein
LSLLSVFFIGFFLSLFDQFGVRVQFFHGFFISERVFLLNFVDGSVFLDWVDNGLDFIGIDDSGNISVGEN